VVSDTLQVEALQVGHRPEEDGEEDFFLDRLPPWRSTSRTPRRTGSRGSWRP
jgi:hypothetical protein